MITSSSNTDGKDTDDKKEVRQDTSRLFVRNLAYDMSEQDLEKLFTPFGILKEVHLSRDADGIKSKGYGFVEYLLQEDSVAARAAMDGKIVGGRLLHVLPAQKRDDEDDDNAKSTVLVKSSFKKKKEKQRKATAESDHNWNPLYMRSDAVAEAIATKFGVSKADVLDARSDSRTSVAVRVALGETHIISETKKMLREHGINVQALENAARGKVRFNAYF